MDRSVTSAWALEPIASLRLGDRDHPVPPLTLGRFQRLIEMDARPIIMSVLGEFATPPPRAARVFGAALRWAILRATWATRPLWWAVETLKIGKGCRSARAAAPLVALVVPSATAEEWERHGSMSEFLRLFLLFANKHDWSYIGESIRFGEPMAEGELIPTEADVTAGLLAVAKESGYTIEGLTAMRVEGFYRLTDALRKRTSETCEDPEVPPGMEMSDELPRGLMDLLDKAKEAARGE